MPEVWGCHGASCFQLKGKFSPGHEARWTIAMNRKTIEKKKRIRINFFFFSDSLALLLRMTI